MINVYLRPTDFITDLGLLVSYLPETLPGFEGVVIVGGDFNGRIESQNQLPVEFVENSFFAWSRNNKDNVSNKNGQILCHELESLGLVVLNGRSPSDPRGEYTFVNSNGARTVDLIWTNHSGLSFFLDFSVMTPNLSDHSPVSVSCYLTTSRPNPLQPRGTFNKSKLV